MRLFWSHLTGFRGALRTSGMRSGNRYLHAMPIRKASCVKYGRYSLRYNDTIKTVASPWAATARRRLSQASFQKHRGHPNDFYLVGLGNYLKKLTYVSFLNVCLLIGKPGKSFQCRASRGSIGVLLFHLRFASDFLLSPRDNLC